MINNAPSDQQIFPKMRFSSLISATVQSTWQSLLPWTFEAQKLSNWLWKYKMFVISKDNNNARSLILTLPASVPRETSAPQTSLPPSCTCWSGPPRRPSGHPHWTWSLRSPPWSARTSDADRWRLFPPPGGHPGFDFARSESSLAQSQWQPAGK